MNEILTDSQKEVLIKMLNPDYEVVQCTNGYAFWNKEVRESQGRTYFNKIKNKDFKFFLKNKYIQYNDYIDIYIEGCQQPIRRILIDGWTLTTKGKRTALKLQIAELTEQLRQL